MTSFLMKIIAFGVQGRIDNSVIELEGLATKRNELIQRKEEKQISVNGFLLRVVDAKKNAVLNLQKINQIKGHLTVEDREIINFQTKTEGKVSTIDNIERSLSLGMTALNASKGLSTGYATATATYFLVAEIAAASTETAISTLSGAAATNATLTWLAGGALAAGGGGVAAGTVVMGGLVAIPALAIMGIFSHYSANKKIKEVAILSYQLIEEQSQEVLISLAKAIEAFDFELGRTIKFLYSVPFISRAY